MEDFIGNEIAESIGRRVLQWKGSEFIELIYMLDEKNLLKYFRIYSSLSAVSQDRILEFMDQLAQLDDPELRVDRSGIYIEKG